MGLDLTLAAIYLDLLNLRVLVAVGLMLFCGCGLIRAGLREREGGSWHCPHCDYNLTGLSSRICPECGTPIDKRTANLGDLRPQWGVIVIGAILLLAALNVIVRFLLGISL